MLSYYVDALWFGSLGYGDVFWTTLNLQGAVFAAAFAVTFGALYGAFLTLKPAQFGEIGTDGVIIDQRPAGPAAGRPRPVADRASWCRRSSRSAPPPA